MQGCKRCGQIRPDSQTTCDCSAPERRFDRHSSAVWSTTALFATIGAAVGVLSIERMASGAGFAAIGKFLLVLLLAFAGILVNGVAGIAAHRSGEAWGARIAVFGIAILVGTLLVLYAR